MIPLLVENLEHYQVIEITIFDYNAHKTVIQQVITRIVNQIIHCEKCRKIISIRSCKPHYTSDLRLVNDIVY